MLVGWLVKLGEQGKGKNHFGNLKNRNKFAIDTLFYAKLILGTLFFSTLNSSVMWKF